MNLLTKDQVIYQSLHFAMKIQIPQRPKPIQISMKVTIYIYSSEQI